MWGAVQASKPSAPHLAPTPWEVVGVTMLGTGPGNGLEVFDQALSLGLLVIGVWWLWRSPVSFFAVWGGLLLWWEAESLGGHNPVPWLVLGLLLAVRKAGAIGRLFTR